MKKSLAYYMAQMSVLADDLIDTSDKLEIIRILQEAETVAKYTEKAEREREGVKHEEL